uniref:Uncharacterized protein n=1 Tax=Aegilops tauschii subsp. strangulata TaxID=200361 RepID=A0A452XLQ0_AEGTS
MEGVDPMLAMASSTGVVADSSPNAVALSVWDAQQLQVMSLTNPVNPLLLASACVGSSAALDFLFRREDNQEAPMVMPTRDFLGLLVGNTPGTGGRRVAVPQASGSVEDGDDQPSFPSASRLLTGVAADGGTALHVVASHGDDAEFLKCATIISKRDQGLMFAVNKKGDTPLHCAARAGKSKMVSCLVKLAERCNRLREFLRKENVLMETALHDGVRAGRNDIVELLLGADPDLANYPEQATSPLYLAILMRRDDTAQALHDKSNGNLSYSGPNGQNALHAATFQGSGIKKLVKWNNSLTIHGDRDGSTPLHLASSFQNHTSFEQLFKANPAPTYQADNNGFFPIHVAASAGRKNTISIILKKFPSSAGLCTGQGRTFLHVAVVKKRLNIVSFVCQNPSLAWILNMQDNDGNTALHLAVQAGKLRMFCCLYGNKEVCLSLTNNSEETPVDLARNYLPCGMHYNWVILSHL